MKFISPRVSTLVFAVVFGLGSLQAQLITFSELTTRPVNGVTVNGVTFSFTGSGEPGIFGDPNGPSQPMAYVNKPWLTGGTTGAFLTMQFSQPISSLRFGYALNTNVGGSVTNAMNVSLYSPSSLFLGTTSYNATSVLWSAEGLYNQIFATPVARVVLQFSSSYTFFGWEPLFGVDNISYTRAALTPVPEPGTYGITAGVFLFGVLLFRRFRATRKT